MINTVLIIIYQTAAIVLLTTQLAKAEPDLNQLCKDFAAKKITRDQAQKVLNDQAEDFGNYEIQIEELCLTEEE